MPNAEHPQISIQKLIRQWAEHPNAQNFFLALLVATLLLVLLGIALVTVFIVQSLPPTWDTYWNITDDSSSSRSEVVRNLGLLVAAVIGLGFGIWRTWTAHRQANTAQKQANIVEQGHITNRINESVKGLGSEKTVKEFSEIPRYQREGDDWKRDKDCRLLPALRPDGTAIIDRKVYERTSPNLEVRIGAIYALERIAQDSPRDHIQIMEILCAYLRENASAKSLEPTEPPFNRDTPRTDIQATISVIGRRSSKQIELEWERQFRLDIRNTNLSGVDFKDGDFSAAMFHGCRLEGAHFDDSKLLGTQFFGSLLNFSSFYNSKLRGTRFDRAIINRPFVIAGGMAESINMGDIYGISVVAANLTAIDYLGEPDKMNLVFGSKDTKLCSALEFDRSGFNQKLIKIRQLKKTGMTDQASEIETELYKNGFVDWVPYNSDDSALSYRYREFLNKLDLVNWPYQ